MDKGNSLDYLVLPSTLLRSFLFLCSLVLMVLLVTKTIVNTQQIDFKQNAHLAVYHIQEQIVTNDVALAGFSSLFATLDPNALQKTRDFTQYMRAAYPHIYMFEAMFRVDASQKLKHEEDMRALGYPDYKVTPYGTEKKLINQPDQALTGVPAHYPIVFIDPFFASLEGLMGFDMMSVSNMRETLLASIASGVPVASKTFNLREGGRGYALIKVQTLPDTEAIMEQRHNQDYQPPLMFSRAIKSYSGDVATLIIIRADTIAASVADIVPAAKVQLIDGPEGQLAAEFNTPQILDLPVINIETLLFRGDLDDLAQPFKVLLSQPAGLYSQHIKLITLLVLLMCIAYGFYYRSLLSKYRLQLQRDAGLLELSQQHTKLEMMVAKRTAELQRQSDENTNLAQQLIRVQEDQIHHIARELHDEFGQTLTAIKINAHILEQAQTTELVGTYAQDITSQADALYATMRDMIQRLRPEALDAFGLKAAVEQCMIAFHLDEQNIDLALTIDDSVNDLEELYSIASYRIVQELVNNAVKHAQLNWLKVHLTITDQHMHIMVEDNGVGFDPIQKKLGFGLSGVDERARSLGGVVDINTAIGKGVRVCVSMPL
ncbi:CHASE domain-containing protein [Candidatus Njordibacter sp. Uisw_058]|uniref:CHASE domain-containing protein n=1 Tax=Candidatus Njordibacter sp. Uisw_058 TaxID=3230974 RepID=UPI003D3FEFEC